MQKQKNKETGITLISLVVTIIVLIILAGVSIAMLVGENGIITQAQKAAQETEIKGDEEKIRLAINAAQIASNGNSNIEKDDLEIALLDNGVKSIVVDKEDGTRNIIFLDSKKIYKLNNDGSIEDTNNNFDSIYVAPETQDEARNEGVIGIGTDGQPVDMDLWEYSLYDDGTYRLNIEDATESSYRGEITEEGEIIGEIPQYISVDNGKNYIEVSYLYKTFQGLSNLKVAPKIPSSVTSMVCTFSHTGITEAPYLHSNIKNLNWTFEYCPSLSQMPNIPDKVTSMAGTFYYCSNLSVLTKIPSSVTDLHNTFSGCTSLLSLPQDFFIPENVTNINQIFWNCSHLKTIPNNLKIPQNVEDVSQAFAGCLLLEGNVLMDCTPNDYENCFQNTSSETQIKLKVNYTKNCNNIDSILLSGTALKGVLVDI